MHQGHQGQILWLGFIVHPTHRLLKRRNAVNFSRKLATSIDDYEVGCITFAELAASVQGWINQVRFADTWGLREHIFASHQIAPHRRPLLEQARYRQARRGSLPRTPS